MASLPTILLILAALSMGATVIAVIIAFRSQKEADTAIFPITREEEINRAQRARVYIFVWLAVTALFFGGWLATLRLTNPNQPETAASQPATEQTPVQAVEPEQPVVQEPTPTEEQAVAQIEELATEPPPTNTPQSEATDAPVATQPQPTEAPPTSTFTPEPTPTETPIPPTDTPVPPTNTPTPEPTATPVLPTNTPTPFADSSPFISSSRTPAPPEVHVGPIVFASEITDDLDPVDPGTRFPDGVEQIYAIFPFEGMSKGLDYAAIWYQNGQELAREEGKWPWGTRAKSFTFIVPHGEGLYKLDLYINDTVVATKIFEIR